MLSNHQSTTTIQRQFGQKYHQAPQHALFSWETTLQQLQRRYQRLIDATVKQRWDNLTEAERVAKETEKLAIMRLIYSQIIQQYQIRVEEEQAVEVKKSFWRKSLFVFLIVADIALMSIGGYLGSLDLLQLLAPAASTIVTTLVAGITTAIESIMMYSIFKPWLQKGLSLPVEKPPETLATVYHQKIDLIEKINSTMLNNISNTHKKSTQTYLAFSKILKNLNADMRNAQLVPFKETMFKKVGRYLLSGLNFALSIAGTYFGTVMLLTAVNAALIGTPVGWGIIGAFIIAQLISRLVMRKQSLFLLLNPSAKQHNTTVNRIEKYKEATDGIDQKIDQDHAILASIKNIKPRQIKAAKVITPQADGEQQVTTKEIVRSRSFSL